jgi:Ca2+-binding RTX toxin-like protein/LmbE family N-acetylglucosaminyl deacetylase
MKGFGVVLATVAAVLLGVAGEAVAAPTVYKAPDAVKLDVMGEWAHPDDDTSIIGPCGVWHQRYGTRCGIIMVTRGEGGGNAVGSEIGPDLGLRRENEDRVAHFRSGTVDIFNLDRVDFFYNRSAPLTQFFWKQEETLRRITRIIRMTQPEVYIGFTPTLNAGHGNHQQAGRYIWEGVLAAADPTRFPEQLQGPDALDTWQVKKVFSGGDTDGSGQTTTAPDCMAGFVPDADNLDTVVGVWTGYESPFDWPAGNVQGQPAGSPKSWAQVAREGTFAYPTQSRTMFKEVRPPECARFGMTQSFVPFQPNSSPAAGRDEAILFGASVEDPGGLPRGTLEYLRFERFFNVPDTPFEVTFHAKSGSGALRAGEVTLTVPSGWTVDDATKDIGPITQANESTVTFTVTPDEAAEVDRNYRISALLTTGGRTGYTDNVVRIVPPAEGRFQRWGRWQEYDNWLTGTAPQALRLGRSPAVQSMGVGETVPVKVNVHNWSDSEQSGTVSLDPPPGGQVTADVLSQSYGPLAAGADEVLTFMVSNTYTNATLPVSAAAPNAQDTNVPIEITTSYDEPAGESTEVLTMAIVPKTEIPAGAPPALDGAEGAGEYPGEALDVGRKWEPGGSNRNCSPVGTDCGSAGAPGSPTSTYAKVKRSGDDLYFFVHVRDDFQSYAVKPSECVGHWLADSVELLIDPRGDATDTNRDTASTFKLGIFPYTFDPSGSNGNGPNGPCWARDADNFQGYSTGPLSLRNAEGVQVFSTASWVGTNETGTDHAYAGGGYNLEVKIPLSLLPAAVDPQEMALNITPYDNDNTAEGGSGTLRHIDQSTRLAWSTFGSVQSDPWLWGRATMPGYTPQPKALEPPKLAQPLNSADSPQTIHQSARNGVPLSGRPPAPASNRITTVDAALEATSVEIDVTASGPGKARFFLWTKHPGWIPVFKTSCATPPDDPDYGLSACSPSDGGIPPWGTDMSGRVVAKTAVDLTTGLNRISIPVSAGGRAALAADGRLLIGFETPEATVDERKVQAMDVPLGGPRPKPPAAPSGGLKRGRCANPLVGTAAGERLRGTPFGDDIFGGSGADFIEGLAGRDCIHGKRGDDVLRGGLGTDSVDGGRGDDRVSGGRGRGTLRGGGGADRVKGGARRDVVQGNTGADRLAGGKRADQLLGGFGADRIAAGRGADLVEAGPGADRIRARDGRADRIDCGFGRDTVVSRDPDDRLTGCEIVGG